MNLDEMNREDCIRRLKAYEDALRAVWKARPCDETQLRFSAFQNSKHLKRIHWVKWVEDNATRIDWCRELVCEAVTSKLGINQ